MIVKSFTKCDISNAMDGTEDDMIYDDVETSDDEIDGDDELNDCYDDEISEEILATFRNNEDDPEFKGFGPEWRDY